MYGAVFLRERVGKTNPVRDCEMRRKKKAETEAKIRMDPQACLFTSSLVNKMHGGSGV